MTIDLCYHHIAIELEMVDAEIRTGISGGKLGLEFLDWGRSGSVARKGYLGRPMDGWVHDSRLTVEE